MTGETLLTMRRNFKISILGLNATQGTFAGKGKTRTLNVASARMLRVSYDVV